MDDVNVLEIPAKDISPEDLPEQIVMSEDEFLSSLTKKVAFTPILS